MTKLELRLDEQEHTVELAARHDRVTASIDDRSIEADVVEAEPRLYSIIIQGQTFEARVEQRPNGLRVFVLGKEYRVEIRDPRKWQRDNNRGLGADERQHVIAPMPGKVVRLLVRPGDSVQVGDGLLVVEAMKMQNEVRSPKSGVVETILVTEGQAVSAGDPLGFIV